MEFYSKSSQRESVDSHAKDELDNIVRLGRDAGLTQKQILDNMLSWHESEVVAAYFTDPHTHDVFEAALNPGEVNAA